MADLKIGVALWSFGPTTTMDELKRKLDLTVEVGAKAVQPWCVDYDDKGNTPCVLDPDRCTGSQRTEVVKAIESRGLTVSAWCAQLAGPNEFGGFGDEVGLDDRIEKTARAIEMAVDLGAPIVTTHVGEIPEASNDPYYPIYLDSVGKVVKRAEKVGGIFAMETGQESAECLRRFIEDLASPAAKCNYDPANMLPYGPVEGVSVLKDHIVHTHAKDRDPETGRATLGMGNVPWKLYLAALQEIGYQGWYAIEDESGQDVVESIRTGVEFLKSC